MPQFYVNYNQPSYTMYSQFNMPYTTNTSTTISNGSGTIYYSNNSGWCNINGQRYIVKNGYLVPEEEIKLIYSKINGKKREFII